mgnify:CR=1 FL=1|jgi:uncharacterized OB-fold protein
MAKKKYEGSYNQSLLKPLIENGSVFVECPNCGAEIDNWVVIISNKCPKCHQNLGVVDRIKEANKQEEIEQANKIAQQYEFVKNILLNNRGCVYAGYQSVSVYTGDAAFSHFVDIVQHSHYTCLQCPACGYIHIAQILSPGDVFAAGSLFLLKRRVGIDKADNWEGIFTCRQCNQKSQVHVQLSMDYVSGKITNGDPFFFLSKNMKSAEPPSFLNKLFGRKK